MQSDTAHLKKKSSRTQKYYKNTLQKYTEMKNSVNCFSIRTIQISEELGDRSEGIQVHQRKAPMD